ncbi:hypothetical protein IWQ61_009473, partial [Dispira simplex]
MTDAEVPSAHAPAFEYYAPRASSVLNRTRTLSTAEHRYRMPSLETAPETKYRRRRRGSHDEK